jgi:redox-sensitive bicupin YhaK (pirin superfamily)
MLAHYPSKSLAYTNHGGLQTKHHFSFAQYYNSSRMGFGALRVVNDDLVEPSFGFDPHPHRNMEIVSYVRSGSIVHQDSEGNNGVTKAGEVQVMSAGKGIVHSEYNRSKVPLTFYQIWIETNTQNAKPRWQTKPFPRKAVSCELTLLVSGFQEDRNKALPIHQEARIYGGRIKKGVEIEHRITNQAYALASDGCFDVVVYKPEQKVVMQKGDGLEITDTKIIYIKAIMDCEVLIIDVPT